MSNKKDRAFGFFRSLFIGLAVALLILLGVIGYRLYESATREIVDSEVVYVDDTEAVELLTAASETEAAAETGIVAETDISAENDIVSETDAAQAAASDTASAADGVQGAETETETASAADDTQKEAAAASDADAALSAQADASSETDSASQAEEDDTQDADGTGTDDIIIIEGEVVDAASDTDTAAEESTGVYSTLNAACNFRSEAGYEDADGNDTTITTCAAGTVVEVLEEVGGWTKVKIDGVVGYVGAQFITDTDTDE
ncbi:MAG: SH3 domain-containing protein [Clostridiales bacterium]|nr:SH3 domain-containing protein [Clostridiales bacterium]